MLSVSADYTINNKMHISSFKSSNNWMSIRVTKISMLADHWSLGRICLKAFAVKLKSLCISVPMYLCCFRLHGCKHLSKNSHTNLNMISWNFSSGLYDIIGNDTFTYVWKTRFLGTMMFLRYYKTKSNRFVLFTSISRTSSRNISDARYWKSCGQTIMGWSKFQSTFH